MQPHPPLRLKSGELLRFRGFNGSVFEMSTSRDQTACDTIELLEARLKRLHYVITGHHPEVVTTNSRTPANVMLKDLERGLDQLIAKSKVIQDLLKLRKL